MRFYDRQGRPIDLTGWVALMKDMDYKRVALTEVCEGIQVSTVWLGSDHNWSAEGPPLIFETMVFVALDEPRKAFGMPIDSEGTEMWRWGTEAQALAGHDQVVAGLRAQVPTADRE